MIRFQNKIAFGALGALMLMLVAAMASVTFGGPLDPPGTPAPTQENLIFQPANCAAFPIAISTPGSYKLAQDITIPSSCAKDGITINAGDVTVDLDGFTLTGAVGSLAGVHFICACNADIAVRNGIVTGWQGNGIDLSSAKSGSVDQVTTTNNLNGIVQSSGSAIIVKDCIASRNLRDGIDIGVSGQVTGCDLDGNGGCGLVVSGPGSLASRNNVRNSGVGFDSGTSSGGNTTTTLNDTSKSWAPGQWVGSTVQIIGGTGTGENRPVLSNTATQLTLIAPWPGPTPDATSMYRVFAPCGTGILVSASDVSVEGNNVSLSGNGITFSGAIVGGLIANNSVFHTGDGIDVVGNGIRIDGNHIAGGCCTGILVGSVASNPNIITRNSAGSTGTPYNIGSGNDSGPITTAALMTNPDGNISD